MGTVADQKERIIGQVKRFLKRAGLDEAILFGSRVRGDYLSTSDVDVIVISPRFEGVRVIERMYQMHDAWEGDEFLEVLPYTPEEFERAREFSGVVQAALEHGIRIRAEHDDAA